MANVDTEKMVLRVRSKEKMKQTEMEEEEVRETKKRKSKSQKKNVKVDVMKPKKPPTAFFFFLEDFRKGFREQNPNVKNICYVGKAGGEKWKTMTYEEKIKYYDMATEKRAEFDKAMVNFIKRMKSGEDREPEVDSEYELRKCVYYSSRIAKIR